MVDRPSLHGENFIFIIGIFYPIESTVRQYIEKTRMLERINSFKLRFFSSKGGWILSEGQGARGDHLC